MQVFSLNTLRDFWEVHPRAKAGLEAWHVIAKEAEWRSPADIRAAFKDADFVGDNRVIFDIRNNEFRLVVHVKYVMQVVMVKFVGTHAQYDRIDAEKHDAP